MIDTAVGRPPGWLEEHAGIRGRRVWAGQDPLAAAAAAAQDCLVRAEVAARDVGALLVTAEAPPRLAGLAAALHDRLRLPAEVPALEVGGACTGFLNGLWLAERLLPRAGMVLVCSVESPSTLLPLAPGPTGDMAALFGDGAAASLVCDRPLADDPAPLSEVWLGTDGGSAGLLRVEWAPPAGLALHMDGPALAGRALAAMDHAVRGLAERHGLAVGDLAGVVMHGGNGRLPGLLARRLGLPAERVWSETAATGNLGSASLPVAWKARQPAPAGPVAWTAVGAGLTWAATLTGAAWG